MSISGWSRDAEIGVFGGAHKLHHIILIKDGETMKIIGLTGGIASGKSMILRLLEELGAVVVDSDKLAHKAMEPHTPGWRDITDAFGSEILNQDMTINRKKLGKIVFNDRTLLLKLNEIIHPRIAEKFKDILSEVRKSHADNSVIVIEVPLLYETRMDRLCDEVWVVWVDEATQIKRLIERDGISEADAMSRINSQMPIDEKAKRADFVINNMQTIEETKEIAAKYYNEMIQGNL